MDAGGRCRLGVWPLATAQPHLSGCGVVCRAYVADGGAWPWRVEQLRLVLGCAGMRMWPPLGHHRCGRRVRPYARTG